MIYFEIRASRSGASAAACLKNLLNKTPFEIKIILTDNGKESTDRFCATGRRKPTGYHPFDTVCQKHQVEHLLIRPRYLQPGWLNVLMPESRKSSPRPGFNQQPTEGNLDRLLSNI